MDEIKTNFLKELSSLEKRLDSSSDRHIEISEQIFNVKMNSEKVNGDAENNFEKLRDKIDKVFETAEFKEFAKRQKQSYD